MITHFGLVRQPYLIGFVFLYNFIQRIFFVKFFYLKKKEKLKILNSELK